MFSGNFITLTNKIKVYAPIDSENKLHKRRFYIDFPWDLIPDRLLMNQQSKPLNHNQLPDMQHSKLYIPVLKVLEYCWRHFTYLKLYKCSQIPHPSPRVASVPNRTKTNRYWLNHLYTHTESRHPAHERSERNSQTPGVTQGNLRLASPPHSFD